MADERKPTRRPNPFKAFKASIASFNALPGDNPIRRAVEQYAQSERGEFEAEFEDHPAQPAQSPSEIEKAVAGPAAQQPIANSAEPSEAGRGTPVITISEFDEVEPEKPAADSAAQPKWPWHVDPEMRRTPTILEVRRALEANFRPEQILGSTTASVLEMLRGIKPPVLCGDTVVRQALGRR